MSTIAPTASDLIFVDSLPPASRGITSVSRIARAINPLRGLPGQWAMLTEPRFTNTASAIQAGKYKGIKPGEFEAKTRTRVADMPPAPKNKAYIFVRYVGQ
jgi:hypothetical protein